ncbi:hypothetical protein Hdeb2414_s0007g00261051 [Helianthus debilis subsp. tardiflorus]
MVPEHCDDAGRRWWGRWCVRKSVVGQVVGGEMVLEATDLSFTYLEHFAGAGIKFRLFSGETTPESSFDCLFVDSELLTYLQTDLEHCAGGLDAGGPDTGGPDGCLFVDSELLIHLHIDLDHCGYVGFLLILGMLGFLNFFCWVSFDFGFFW